MRSCGSAGRRDREGLLETGQVGFHILARGFIGRPGANVFRLNANRSRRTGGFDVPGRDGKVRRTIVSDVFQKFGIMLSDFGPRALGLHPLARPCSQLLPDFRAADKQIQVLKQVIFLGGIHGRLQADGCRQFGERSDVGDDHRLAQPKRAHQRSRVLANRGIAEIEDDIAGGEIADKLVDRAEAEHSDVRAEIQRSDQGLQLQFGMRLAHQYHLGRRMDTHQPAERTQRFRDALVGFQKPEDADERRGHVDSQALAKFGTAGVGNPSAMRDTRHRAGKSRAA